MPLAMTNDYLELPIGVQIVVPNSNWNEEAPPNESKHDLKRLLAFSAAVGKYCVDPKIISPIYPTLRYEKGACCLV